MRTSQWFSIPQCWRYERMTRGRRREHYQWNLDVWGVDALTAEVELLSAAVTFMTSVGLSADDVGIKISTRLVLSELLTSLGVPEDKFASTCVLVDKLDKLPADEVRAALLEQGLPADSAEKLLTTLAITDFAALESAMGADSPAVLALKELFDLADAYGLKDWLVLDLSVVRRAAHRARAHTSRRAQAHSGASHTHTRVRGSTPHACTPVQPRATPCNPLQPVRRCAGSRTTRAPSSRASIDPASSARSLAAGGTISCSRRLGVTTSPPPASASEMR